MYDYIIVDSVNMGYLVLNKSSDVDLRKEAFKFGGKRVYKLFIKEYLNTINLLKAKFLNENGKMIFLFDNYTSREEIRNMLKPLSESARRKDENPEYKSQRKREQGEFYNSLDTIRYYLLVGDNNIHTARIPNLEADDLVAPCIKYFTKKSTEASKILMVTNDSDWCRYLNDTTDYLPHLYKNPVNKTDFETNHGYEPNEDSIILNKIIYGDSADNIEAVFPEFNSKTKKYIVDNFKSVVDFMYDAGSHENLKEFVTLIKDREKDIRLSYQMLATIPVADAHFKAVLTTGRQSKSMVTMINKLVFDNGDIEKAKFSFGGIKVPRFNPS